MAVSHHWRRTISQQTALSALADGAHVSRWRRERVDCPITGSHADSDLCTVAVRHWSGTVLTSNACDFRRVSLSHPAACGAAWTARHAGWSRTVLLFAAGLLFAADTPRFALGIGSGDCVWVAVPNEGYDGTAARRDRDRVYPLGHAAIAHHGLCLAGRAGGQYSGDRLVRGAVGALWASLY